MDLFFTKKKYFFFTLILVIVFCFNLTVVKASDPDSAPSSLPSYNTKAFDLGNGQTRYEIHSADINYKDAQGNFQPIDTALSFDATNRVWKLNKASYIPSIPEYADGVMDFRNVYEDANLDIKTIPQTSHVKGTYVKEGNVNYIIYKDAFGEGIDLKITPNWYGLAKVIILNNKPGDTSKDLTFDFQIQIFNTSNFEIKKQDGTKFDYTQENSNFNFTGKTITLGANGKYTYFKNAYIWDSNGKQMPVDIQLYTKDGNIYLRKTIKTDILNNAAYPLYTDTDYTTVTGNGGISHTGIDTTWSDIHDNTAGATDTDNPATYSIEVSYGEGGWDCTPPYTEPPDCARLYDGGITRAFFEFDTSAIDDSATITAASLTAYLQTTYNGVLGDGLGVTAASQTDSTNLVAGDFDNVGSSWTDSAIAYSTIYAGAGNQTFTFNATGRSGINKTGGTKLAVRDSSFDIANSPPGVPPSANIYATISMSASDNDPYLSVTAVTNTVPVATSVSVSPGSVKVGSSFTFTGNWTEADAGDQDKMYVCKDLACTNCNNASQTSCWCYSSSYQTQPDTTDTCTYTAQTADIGNRNFWLNVCDDEPSCSAAFVFGRSFTVGPASSKIFTVKGTGVGITYYNLRVKRASGSGTSPLRIKCL
mgnify:CR=1 FL=1